VAAALARGDGPEPEVTVVEQEALRFFASGRRG